MADYIFGLAISSLIALFLGINKKWRIFNRKGLRNSLTLMAILIASLIIYGDIGSDSSNAAAGFLGIATFPLYIFARSMVRRLSRSKDAAPTTSSGQHEKNDRDKELPAAIQTKPVKATADTQQVAIRQPVTISKSSGTGTLTKKQNLVKDEGFPDWHISITFGKSRSENFPQAVGLAIMAPKYLENIIKDKTMHQAIYSSKPSEYLAFIKLYELVSNWKSCFVIINGQMVDRKIVGGLNYCYGDKCRSGNPEFCYGASYMTENPFGCHRIQISACNNPWWTFGRFDNKGVWLVDKKAMLKRILEYSEPYRLCPAFSIDNVMDALKNLPDRINPKKDKNWIAVGSMITPARNQSALEFTIRLNLIGDKRL